MLLAKNKHKKSQLPLWFMALVSLACHASITYQKTHTLANKIWPATATQRFILHIPDNKSAYDMILLVSNNKHYPYQNLFVACELKDEKRDLLKKDLKDYLLFDPKTGKSLGKGWNKKKNHSLSLYQGYQFPHPGIYYLELMQFMRTENLAGIETIGIQVVKSTTHAPKPKDT